MQLPSTDTNSIENSNVHEKTSGTAGSQKINGSWIEQEQEKSLGLGRIMTKE
jgi:hypothetical protein